MRTERGAVKSASRVLDLLELLAGAARPLPHNELAASLGIPKSSLTGLIGTLQDRDYVSAQARGYALGPAAERLARHSREGLDLVRLAEPVLRRLVAETNESCGVNVRRGDESELVRAANGSLPLLVTMRVGERAPLYATSSGKVLLAFLPAPEREAYLARVRFEPITPKTIRAVGPLRRQLAEAARAGLAWSREEFTPGITGMAVPVPGPGGAAICAVNIAIPSARLDRAHAQRVEAALRRAVAALAGSLDPEPRKQNRRAIA